MFKVPPVSRRDPRQRWPRLTGLMVFLATMAALSVLSHLWPMATFIGAVVALIGFIIFLWIDAKRGGS